MLLPSIGKRQILSDFEEKQNGRGEEVRVKWGKLDNVEVTVSKEVAGVDDHPYQEQ